MVEAGCAASSSASLICGTDTPDSCLYSETRFRMVEKLDPVRFKRLLMSAEKQARQRVAIYKQLSNLVVPQPSDAEIEASAPAAPAAKN